jgi:hypothetical protein
MTRDVYCPLCKYNLRLLSQPRCPECGYRFTWSEVLVQLDLHPYLFEHHPEKPVRSCVRTFLAAWCPRRFWSSVRPNQPLNGRRLIVYAMIGAASLLFMSAVSFVLGSAVLQAKQMLSGPGNAWSPFSIYTYPSSISDALVLIARGQGFASNAIQLCSGLIWPLTFAVPVTWLASTVLILLTLRISMRRARIRPVHMLRCTIYSFDLLAWTVLVAVVGAGLPLLLPWDFTGGFLPYSLWGTDPLYYLMVVGVLMCVLMSAWRLWRALSLYLRFDHAAAVVLTTQVVALLGAGLVIANFWPRLFQRLLSFFWLI